VEVLSKYPVNIVSISIDKMISSNTRRNPRVVMVENVAFMKTTQDNKKYLTSENALLQKELASIKQQDDHLATENQ